MHLHLTTFSKTTLEMEDYGDLETGENYVNGADEWNQLDEWQSQIETDFDYIYSTLQNVKAPGPSASTPYPLPTQRSSCLNVFSSVSRNVSPRTSTQLKSKTKKTVAFDDADEVQVIEEIEEVDDDIDNSFSISNATNKGIFEEAEYSYGGLLRPGSHKPEGYAKSFEHYLNTQDLDKNVQRLKSLSGDDRVRVRKHRKRRSRSPGGSKSPLRNTPLPNSVDSDYDRLPPSYYSVRSSSNKTGYGGDSGNCWFYLRYFKDATLAITFFKISISLIFVYIKSFCSSTHFVICCLPAKSIE